MNTNKRSRKPLTLSLSLSLFLPSKKKRAETPPPRARARTCGPLQGFKTSWRGFVPPPSSAIHGLAQTGSAAQEGNKGSRAGWSIYVLAKVYAHGASPTDVVKQSSEVSNTRYAAHKILSRGPRHQRGSSKRTVWDARPKTCDVPPLLRAGFELPLVERKAN